MQARRSDRDRFAWLSESNQHSGPKTRSSNLFTMPRPKVRPEDRQRAVKACLPCKSSKKKCDSRMPCSNCRQRERETSCVYDPDTHHQPSSLDGRHRPVRSSDSRRKAPVRPASLHGEAEDLLYDDPTTFRSARHAPRTPESTLAPFSDATSEVPTSPRMSISHNEVPGRVMGNSKVKKGKRHFYR